jgi:glycosyltransferase involved in cell wall biosynthesis
MSKTAFIAFYTVYPSNMGSSEVSSSFFETWSGEKKIFQISHIKKVNNKKVHTKFIKKETPINKILQIIPLALAVKKYLLNTKNPNIIIEGPSWIGYSFIFYIIIKLFLKKTFIIYHSHSIEYEIRKNNSFYFISFMTKIMEYFIFNNANVATTVSAKENIKIRNLYNKNTIILPNGLHLKKLNNTKSNSINIKKYILYSGSYLYGPNKQAINLLNSYFMPELLKKYPNLKLVLTGGGYNIKHKWLINLDIIKKNYLVKLLKNSELVLTPIYEGYGTRVKIIEALMLGVPVISSPKGIEGINYKLKVNQSPFVHEKREILLKYAVTVLENNDFYKKKANECKKNYIKIYSMENITKRFQAIVKKIKNG